MDLVKLLTAENSRVLLEEAGDIYERVQAERNKPIPVVITLTGREIDDIELPADAQTADDDDYHLRLKHYFKTHILGQKIHHDFLGEISVNSKQSWQKLKTQTKQKSLRNQLFPAIPAILKHGACTRIETVRSEQKKQYLYFAYLRAKVNLNGHTVDVGLSVVFKDDLSRFAYNLTDKPDELKDNRNSEKYEGVQAVAGFDSMHADEINFDILSNISSSLFVEGRQNKIKTAKGTRLETNLAVIEASDLIASHDHLGNANPNYPQELQPRDRSRDTSRAQIQKIAADLDPESLGRTGRADSGAPIIGTDAVVESGNGRSIAIKLAYQNGTADEYREWLTDNSEYFGLDRSSVEGMKQPVLVRVRKTEIDRAKFAVEANQDDKLSYSATERAKSDAKRLSGNLLDLFQPDDAGNLISSSNQKFISGFLASLGTDEAAQYTTTDGKPTQALVARIKSAVFSKAYNDDRLLEMVADQTNPDLQNVLNALSIAAPKFIQAQSISGLVKGQLEDVSSSIVDSIEKTLDKRIVNAIIDATNVVSKAKYNNQAIAEYVSQLGLFGELEEGVAELAVFISENARSAKKLSIVFKAMAEFSEKDAIDGQNFGLFGEPEPVSIKSAFEYANEKLADQYGDDKAQISMFDSMEAVAQAASVTAGSPVSEIPAPTAEAAISGEYAKGVLSVGSTIIRIENAAGSERKGTDANGKSWVSKMHHHYGYFDGTTGNDGDELDVFIKQGASKLDSNVYIIEQNNPQTGAFDEHKVILGADSAEDAKQIYLSCYEKGWQGFGNVTELTFNQFEEKLNQEWLSVDEYDDTGSALFSAETQESLISNLSSIDAIKSPVSALKSALMCLMYRGTAPAFTQQSPIVNYVTKKGKALQGIVIGFNVLDSIKLAKEVDPYTFKYEGEGWFIRLKHLSGIDDNLLTAQQILLKKGLDNATTTKSNSSNAGEMGEGSGNTGNFADEHGSTAVMAGESSAGNGESWGNGNSATGLSEDNATGGGSGSNRTDANKRKRSIATADFTAANSQRGGSDDGQGSSVKRDRDRQLIQSSKTTAGKLSEKEQQQKDAEGTPTNWGDADNIRQALPYLLEEQQNDVQKAEKRLLDEGKNGILFTNGTGTGKTFTGLGAVKRFVNAGKNNVLIVSMNDKIVRDFVKSGKALGLSIHQLTGIDDNGGAEHSIVATTYANLAQNKTLADKDWNLIIVDESHNLMQSEKGNETNALSKLRALTGHHKGFYTWFEDKFRNEMPDRAMVSAPMFDAKGEKILNEDGTQKTEMVEGNAFAPGPKADKWYLKQEKEKTAWRERWNKQSAGRPKVIFLSATPWSYVTTIEWAEGYLFDYTDPSERWSLKDQASGASYNSGDDKSAFFMRNFGYTMRYNKLTRPDGKVDSGINEREFANKLKESGAVSGRELSVPFDYDRKFILIESSVGKEIDRGLDLLSSEKDENGQSLYSDLYSAVSGRFNYLSRERLLEAIKADAVIDQVKKSIALGRKVILFHDYNDGGGFSPFSFSLGQLHEYSDKSHSVGLLKNQYERFSKEHADLVALNLSFDSPIETLRSAFPSALLFNGRVPKAQRAKNADLFNDDESGKDIIIVQSDAGATGISFHDTTGKHQRVIFNLGLPKRPAKLRQTEGRIYRVGQASNAIHRYLTTGTKWETTAFANTIAQRAETVDNLSKGDDSVVSIRDSIITAYENAEYFEPSLNDGIGGKAYDAENARIAALSQFDKALTLYYNKGKNRDNRKNKIGVDWYATPEPLGLKMMQWAGAHKGDDVLEPSAGDGAIGRWIPSSANGTMIEPSVELASRAQLANTTAKVEKGSFESHSTLIKYDAIVMNPPFGHAGALALTHVKKACQHLREGGRVVALVPQSASMMRGLESWLESSEGKEFYTTAHIMLPDSTFKNANTSVRTFIVILERHSDPSTAPYMRNIDYSHISDNESLFDAIRDFDLAPRSLRVDEKLMEYGLVMSPFRNSHILSGVGIQTPEIKDALLSNRFVYSVANDPNSLECYSRNIKSILETLKPVKKLIPHKHDEFDSWQHDGIFERIQIRAVKVDLTKYIRREKLAKMQDPIVVQERAGGYQLLSGYERFRLAKEKNESFVPAIIVSEQYIVGRNTLAKAYKKTAIPLDTEVFAHNLFDVLDSEAVELLA